MRPAGPAARTRQSAAAKPRAKGPATSASRRDYGAERRRASEREAAELAADAKEKRPYRLPSVERFAESELFQEWIAKPPLTVVAQQVRERVQSAKEKRARAGAAARWGSAAAPEAAPRGRDDIVPQPEATRSWRVGESERERGSHRQYTSEELVYWAEAIVSGRIKWPELQRLYDAGIIRVSQPILARWIYGVPKKDPATKKSIPGEWAKQPNAWQTLKETGEFPPMGRPTLVLTEEQEEALAHVICLMSARRKPLAPAEVKRWAGVCGHGNGTLNDPDDDVRTWYLLFRLRMKKQFGVNIEEVRALEYHGDVPPPVTVVVGTFDLPSLLLFQPPWNIRTNEGLWLTHKPFACALRRPFCDVCKARDAAALCSACDSRHQRRSQVPGPHRASGARAAPRAGSARAQSCRKP